MMSLADTQKEFASATIVLPKPEEFAFVCEVRLDDARNLDVLIPRALYLPGPEPAIGDRVGLVVEDNSLSLAYEFIRQSDNS